MPVRLGPITPLREMGMKPCRSTPFRLSLRVKLGRGLGDARCDRVPFGE